MTATDCVFCRKLRDGEPLVASNELAVALRDGYPVSEGHTLVVPRRHVATWFDATPEEQAAVFELVAEVRERLLATPPKPDGFNIGINVGEAAGQTVMHLHVHVIPRRDGDVDDPSGGVRFVIPERGNYKHPGALPRANEQMAWQPRPPVDLRPRDPLHTGSKDQFIDRIRPCFHGAREVAIVAAFVRDSGLELLEEPTLGAIRGGARVRLLTGDYLHITQARALRQLMDWQVTFTGPDDDEPGRGSFEVKIIETKKLKMSSFHPKSWRFEGAGGAVAWVGSSNISRAALTNAVEWNLLANKTSSPEAYERIEEAFETLWSRGSKLTTEWVEQYGEEARRWQDGRDLPPGEIEWDEDDEPPTPNDVQSAVLPALQQARDEGRQRALVVLATGLGKTFLAAFDVKAFRDARAPERTRVLVLAHRGELLRQAAKTFHRVMPDVRFGWFVGESSHLDGDIVFASVQKLSRPEHLATLSENDFDYVIIDEAHHTAADSYRAILRRLNPAFLLGLTATPERADGADILGLFDEHEAFRMDLGEGIERGLLAPFRYVGVKDTIDYEPIPWRNRRFDPAVLALAAQTEARMETMWRAWESYPGTRTLVFCCAIAHANFVRDWLEARGLRVKACHSGPTSDERTGALDDLQKGALDAVCAVDLFNEGVDVPKVDRVVMLRPTESPVIFLQQLGRGLRKQEDKVLQVIDFVGNHRVFLDRIRTLLTLGTRRKPTSVRAFLEDDASPDLPEGCSVELELDAKDLLNKLLPAPGRNETIECYRELREARGQRPMAGELYRMGYNPHSLHKRYGSWLEFVASEQDLSDEEHAAMEVASGWFTHLEKTPMSRCFKLVVLEVLLDEGALGPGMQLDRLARLCHRRIVASPELFAEISGLKQLPEPRTPAPGQWQAYWRKNPIAAWIGESGSDNKTPWFSLEADTLRWRLSRRELEPSTRSAVVTLTRELVDYRMARYRRGRLETSTDGSTSFRAKIIRNEQHPILMLPSRKKHPDLPRGDTDVRLPDGAIWRFRFVKIACNVAHQVGHHRNELPDLLRRWFGPAAGGRGTLQHLLFRRAPEGWWVEPVNAVPEVFADVIPLTRRPVRAFPTLRAAAGWDTTLLAPNALEADTVSLPTSEATPDTFAIRASGDSMQGLSDDIHDGDWLVMHYARSATYEALVDKVVLIARSEPGEDRSYHLKRVHRTSEGYELLSDHPDFPPMVSRATDEFIAVMVDHRRPASLAPELGHQIPDDDLAAAFQLTAPPEAPWSRIDGHLFLLIESSGTLTAPDRLPRIVPKPYPGETAFVLLRPSSDAPWRYQGVATWLEDEGQWCIPEVDFQTWRALGSGRSASRRLPSGWLDKATTTAKILLDSHTDTWFESRGKRCRLVRGTSAGSLRIDGGPDGFAERTVSLTDLAWVLLARHHTTEHGGLVDEALVNRLRYLDGTPKASTRWIDTGWALVLTATPTIT